MSEVRSDRQCRRCGRFFWVSHREQVYCSRRCYHEDTGSSGNGKAGQLLVGILPRYGTHTDIGWEVGLSRERVRELTVEVRPAITKRK